MAGMRISVRIDETLREKLAQEAASTGVPEADIVRDALRARLHRREPMPSCYEVAKRLGIVGISDKGPPDLSTNRKYFKGFGK